MICFTKSAVWLVLLLVGSMVGCGKEQEIPPAAMHIAAARTALRQGDKTAALRELGASIEIEPSVWAYALRAELYAESGRDDDALADCQAGLQLDADNAQIQWILQELKRPPSNRFQTTSPTISK
jgi:Tfp pilus assembly protein PilF